MTLLQRITAVLERARVAGGWDDEAVARKVLAEMFVARLEHSSSETPSVSDDPDT